MIQRLLLGLELHDLVPEGGHLDFNAVDRLALFEDLGVEHLLALAAAKTASNTAIGSKATGTDRQDTSVGRQRERAARAFGFEQDCPARRHAPGVSWMEDARQLWRLVAQYLPERPPRPPGRAGRAWIPDERVFMRLVLFLRAGCSWEAFDELSKGCGVSGRTVRNRLADWRRTAVFEQVYEVLRRKLDPAAVAHLDSMFVRARCSGDLVGLTRHGKGSKLQALVSDDSMPLAIQLESANPHEAKITPALLDLVDKMPDVVVADRAYDLDELRDEFAERTSKLLAPHRSNRKKPPRDQEQIGRHYKQRWRVERLFAWLVGWRRLATRWEADPLNYNTWVCLATSLIYVRGGLLP